MSRPHSYKGQIDKVQNRIDVHNDAAKNDFVLEKSIFNNIFEKDIRRVFIYKKAERLAKALHLIVPAFAGSASLRDRIDSIAIGLVDAAVLPPGAARTALSRELLALSSVLSIARTGGLLSPMNADLIVREAHTLLQEVAVYEEPRLFLDEVPTLSNIAKGVSKNESANHTHHTHRAPAPTTAPKPGHTIVPVPAKTSDSNKGHAIKDTQQSSKVKDRRDAVLAVIRNKGRVSMKDISTHVRGVSEKTIQRELAALIDEGVVEKEGERRWSVYFLA